MSWDEGFAERDHEWSALYGGFDRSPFTDESREYVWVTRRPG